MINSTTFNFQNYISQIPSFVAQTSQNPLTLIALAVIPVAIYTHRHLDDIFDKAIASQIGMLAKLAYAGGGKLSQQKQEQYVEEAFDKCDFDRMRFLCQFPPFKEAALTKLRTRSSTFSRSWEWVWEKWIKTGCCSDRNIFDLATNADQELSESDFEVLASYCVDSGMNIHQQGSNRNTPLHNAARAGYLKVVRNLVEKGTDINARNSDLMTPLCMALKAGQSDVAEYLIDAGADVHSIKLSEMPQNFRDRDLYNLPYSDSELRQVPTELKGKEFVVYSASPIHLAVRLERGVKPVSEGVIKKLLQKGADINAVADCRTPIDYARDKGRWSPRNIQFLVENGGISNDWDWVLCSSICGIGKIESPNRFLAKLLDLGANINCFDFNGNTPLQIALKKGYEETAEFLLRRGASVMFRNANRKISFD